MSDPSATSGSLPRPPRKKFWDCPLPVARDLVEAVVVVPVVQEVGDVEELDRGCAELCGAQRRADVVARGEGVRRGGHAHEIARRVVAVVPVAVRPGLDVVASRLRRAGQQPGIVRGQPRVLERHQLLRQRDRRKVVGQAGGVGRGVGALRPGPGQVGHRVGPHRVGVGGGEVLREEHRAVHGGHHEGEEAGLPALEREVELQVEPGHHALGQREVDGSGAHRGARGGEAPLGVAALEEPQRNQRPVGEASAGELLEGAGHGGLGRQREGAQRARRRGELARERDQLQVAVHDDLELVAEDAHPVDPLLEGDDHRGAVVEIVHARHHRLRPARGAVQLGVGEEVPARGLPGREAQRAQGAPPRPRGGPEEGGDAQARLGRAHPAGRGELGGIDERSHLVAREEGVGRSRGEHRRGQPPTHHHAQEPHLQRLARIASAGRRLILRA